MTNDQIIDKCEIILDKFMQAAITMATKIKALKANQEDWYDSLLPEQKERLDHIIEKVHKKLEELDINIV